MSDLDEALERACWASHRGRGVEQAQRQLQEVMADSGERGGEPQPGKRDKPGGQGEAFSRQRVAGTNLPKEPGGESGPRSSESTLGASRADSLPLTRVLEVAQPVSKPDAMLCVGLGGKVVLEQGSTSVRVPQPFSKGGDDADFET